jgi:hypothetical protein
MPVFVLPFYEKVLADILVKNPGPKDPALGWPQGEGSRLRAQGTGHKAKTIKKLIFSLCLAPYALRHTFWAGKAIEL